MSKLSVMVGNQPDGLTEFVETCHPTVIYGINTSSVFPGVISVRRIQNADDHGGWDRLPDHIWWGLGTDRWEIEARASARYEALQKTIWVPKRGTMNYIDFSQLAHQDFLSPLNEADLGQPTDSNPLDAINKAKWINSWFEEWIGIMVEHNLKGCIGGWATGCPDLRLVPYLVGSYRLAMANGFMADSHEYGVEGPLMPMGLTAFKLSAKHAIQRALGITTSSTGALHHRAVYNLLPADARPPLVISEFWWGNGVESYTNWTDQINDAFAYGQALMEIPYVVGACAFQLDRGAESCFPPTMLMQYAEKASQLIEPPIAPPPSPPPPSNATVITITPQINVTVDHFMPSTEDRAILHVPKGYIVTIDRQILEQK